MHIKNYVCMYAHTHAVDLLADVLGSQLQVEGEGGAARPKVLDDLSVEGTVTHLRKIMTSDDSEPWCLHGMNESKLVIISLLQSARSL